MTGVDNFKNLSSGAKKLWLEINKKGYFNFNSEENVLKFLLDESLRKGQYKKSEYLEELINDIKYY
jgi:hypothetical protein